MRFFLSIVILCLLGARLCGTEYAPTVCVFSNSQQVGEAVAQKVVSVIVEKQKEGKKSIVLGLATGNSPIPFYTSFKRIVRERDLDLSNIITFNLDEYLGIPASHPQSFYSFMFAHFFDDLLYSDTNPRGIKIENIHIPKGAALSAADLSVDELAALSHCFPQRKTTGSLSEEEQMWVVQRRALDYESLIAELGPIDVQILGIGHNGHIGFAEPHTSFSSSTMVVKLAEGTRKDNASAFKNLESVPTHALTMGIHTILQAQEIILIAIGEHKAEIVSKALYDPISSEIPATALRLHKNTSFFLDNAAVSPEKRGFNFGFL